MVLIPKYCSVQSYSKNKKTFWKNCQCTSTALPGSLQKIEKIMTKFPYFHSVYIWSFSLEVQTTSFESPTARQFFNFSCQIKYRISKAKNVFDRTSLFYLFDEVSFKDRKENKKGCEASNSLNEIKVFFVIALVGKYSEWDFY